MGVEIANPVRQDNRIGAGESATVPVVWTASGENKLRLVAG
jgi:hypothetical protein